ncbi:uncharacterized protein EDB93DRAFT_1126216, partial [Suillus bovinus]|uniref:uncharacterized protein n=1 Tax=Suillus bovinus TaxID=48563 RepID=UPI001B881511
MIGNQLDGHMVLTLVNLLLSRCACSRKHAVCYSKFRTAALDTNAATLTESTILRLSTSRLDRLAHCQRACCRPQYFLVL